MRIPGTSLEFMSATLAPRSRFDDVATHVGIDVLFVVEGSVVLVFEAARREAPAFSTRSRRRSPSEAYPALRASWMNAESRIELKLPSAWMPESLPPSRLRPDCAWAGSIFNQQEGVSYQPALTRAPCGGKHDECPIRGALLGAGLGTAAAHRRCRLPRA